MDDQTQGQSGQGAGGAQGGWQMPFDPNANPFAPATNAQVNPFGGDTSTDATPAATPAWMNFGAQPDATIKAPSTEDTAADTSNPFAQFTPPDFSTQVIAAQPEAIVEPTPAPMNEVKPSTSSSSQSSQRTSEDLLAELKLRMIEEKEELDSSIKLYEENIREIQSKIKDLRDKQKNQVRGMKDMVRSLEQILGIQNPPQVQNNAHQPMQENRDNVIRPQQNFSNKPKNFVKKPEELNTRPEAPRGPRITPNPIQPSNNAPLGA